MNNWHVATVATPVTAGVYRGWLPCILWCEQVFGPRYETWRYITEGVFEFEREADRTAFLLRWG